MTPFANMSPLARRSVLAVSMLIVLLIMTAAAWLLTRTRGGPRAGEQWYLITDANGQTVEWRVVSRTVQKAGSAGYDMVGSGSENAPVAQWTLWRLNSAQDQGAYVSSIFAETGPGDQPLYEETAIIYQDGVIVVTKRIPSPAGLIAVPPRELAAPKDYLPEGSLWQEITTAASQHEAQERSMVWDKTLTFIRVSIQPQEPRPLLVNGSSITVTPVLVQYNRGTSETYMVAPDGTVARIETGSNGRRLIFRSVPFETILQHFPSAAADRTRVLRQRNLPQSPSD
jgi:hypothetical protein